MLYRILAQLEQNYFVDLKIQANFRRDLCQLADHNFESRVGHLHVKRHDGVLEDREQSTLRKELEIVEQLAIGNLMQVHRALKYSLHDLDA